MTYRDIVPKDGLRCLIVHWIHYLASMSPLVTQALLVSACAANTADGPVARSAHAAHLPRRENGFYSLSCSTNGADWPPCSPCGRVLSNSIFDVWHYAHPDEIIHGNADTYVFFGVSSCGLVKRGSMMQKIGALSKNRGRNGQEDEEKRKVLNRKIQENQKKIFRHFQTASFGVLSERCWHDNRWTLKWSKRDQRKSIRNARW